MNGSPLLLYPLYPVGALWFIKGSAPPSIRRYPADSKQLRLIPEMKQPSNPRVSHPCIAVVGPHCCRSIWPQYCCTRYYAALSLNCVAAAVMFTLIRHAFALLSPKWLWEAIYTPHLRTWPRVARIRGGTAVAATTTTTSAARLTAYETKQQETLIWNQATRSTILLWNKATGNTITCNL